MGRTSDHEEFPWNEAPGYMIRDRYRHLRYHRHTSIARHWDSGQAYFTSFTLAERLCRTADRVDPPRVLGSYRGFWRGPPAPNPAILRVLLQPRIRTPICLCC
jgi:hypothetical protein